MLILLQMAIQYGMGYPNNIQENEPNYLHSQMDSFKYPIRKRQEYSISDFFSFIKLYYVEFLKCNDIY